jgi:DinB superfamily
VETVELVRQALVEAHESLERTVSGLDQAALDWQPPGTANPIGATLAHIIVSEDMVTNAILADRAPLLQTSFAGRTGVGPGRTGSRV